MVLGMSLVGLVYGPLGTVRCPELFPTSVRYSGSSLTLQPGGHFRRLARAVRRHLHLAKTCGLAARRLLPVRGRRACSLIGLMLTRETKNEEL